MGNPGVERDQTLSAKEGAFGRVRAETSPSFRILCGHGAPFLWATQVAHACSDIAPAWSGSQGHGRPWFTSVHGEVLGGGSTYCELQILVPFLRLVYLLLPGAFTRPGQAQAETGSASCRPHGRRSPERRRASVHRATGTRLFGRPHSPPPSSSNGGTPRVQGGCEHRALRGGPA